MDHFRKESEGLIQPALDALGRGKPEALVFLFHHYSYLHPEVQRAVFKAIWHRLRATEDHVLASRMSKGGLADLAVDHPLLAREVAGRFHGALNGVCNELSRPNCTDINAVSPAAVTLRQVVLILPLTAIVGAKLRARYPASVRRWKAMFEKCVAITKWGVRS